MWDTAEEVRVNLTSDGFLMKPQHMDMPVLADQQELIYTSFLQMKFGRPTGSDRRQERMKVGGVREICAVRVIL